MKIDSAEILRALRLIFRRGQVAELRALYVRTAGYRTPHTESGYFDNADALAAAAMTLADAPGVYITPNEIDPALLARACNRVRPVGKAEPTTADHAIIRRRWLLIDFDAVRQAGISASDAEHDAAVDRAAEVREWLIDQLRFEEPIYADSGNGGHLMYSIDLPPDDGGLVESCLKALAARWDDDAVKVDTTVHNAARIWKLYGTWARKGDSIPARPHRLARIIFAPPKVELHTTAIARLQALAALAPVTAMPRPAPSNGSGDAFAWLDRWISRHAIPVGAPSPWRDGRIFVFDVCPFNPDHTNASAFITQGADGAIGAGCHHAGCKTLAWGWRDLRAKFDPHAPRQPAIRQTRNDFKTQLAMERALEEHH